MAIDKSNAIYKTETINGKLYRVMYFKGRNGQMIRSKFPQLIKPKSAPMKKKLKNDKVKQTQKPTQRLTTRVVQPTTTKVPRSGSANNLVNEWEELSRR